MKIRIYMKNGTVCPDFPCDEFTVERSNLTGEITGYKFTGGQIPRPVYVNLDEILMIWRVDEDEKG